MWCAAARARSSCLMRVRSSESLSNRLSFSSRVAAARRDSSLPLSPSAMSIHLRYAFASSRWFILSCARWRTTRANCWCANTRASSRDRWAAWSHRWRYLAPSESLPSSSPSSSPFTAASNRAWRTSRAMMGLFTYLCCKACGVRAPRSSGCSIRASSSSSDTSTSSAELASGRRGVDACAPVLGPGGRGGFEREPPVEEYRPLLALGEGPDVVLKDGVPDTMTRPPLERRPAPAPAPAPASSPAGAGSSSVSANVGRRESSWVESLPASPDARAGSAASAGHTSRVVAGAAVPSPTIPAPAPSVSDRDAARAGREGGAAWAASAAPPSY